MQSRFGHQRNHAAIPRRYHRIRRAHEEEKEYPTHGLGERPFSRRRRRLALRVPPRKRKAPSEIARRQRGRFHKLRRRRRRVQPTISMRDAVKSNNSISKERERETESLYHRYTRLRASQRDIFFVCKADLYRLHFKKTTSRARSFPFHIYNIKNHGFGRFFSL